MPESTIYVHQNVSLHFRLILLKATVLYFSDAQAERYDEEPCYGQCWRRLGQANARLILSKIWPGEEFTGPKLFDLKLTRLSHLPIFPSDLYDFPPIQVTAVISLIH